MPAPAGHHSERLEVRRDDLHSVRVVGGSAPEVRAGQALLRVERFAITANTITYAVMGDALRYWGFFPTAGSWGHIPVWGFAEVVDPGDTQLAPGARVFGYVPMATHLAVEPGRLDRSGFVDRAGHRASLPTAYNRYRFVDADPAYAPGTEDEHALLFPLFVLSFVLDDWLATNDFLGAGALVVSSASSKAALGTAFLLAERGKVAVVGLTSGAHVDHAAGVAVYDAVWPYDAVEDLALDQVGLPDRVAFLDFSGDASIRRRVHARCGDRLRSSVLIGATHWDQARDHRSELPGPVPSFFFAPAHLRTLHHELGGDVLDARIAASWRRFLPTTAPWIQVTRPRGAAETRDAYLDILHGHADPACGYVCSMWP
jgi:Protein of unknown function (DUF2855)